MKQKNGKALARTTKMAPKSPKCWEKEKASFMVWQYNLLR